MKTTMAKVGDQVMLTADAEMFFPSRAKVVHEVTSLVRGGVTMAPVMAEGLDWARIVTVFADEVRAVRA